MALSLEELEFNLGKCFIFRVPRSEILSEMIVIARVSCIDSSFQC